MLILPFLHQRDETPASTKRACALSVLWWLIPCPDQKNSEEESIHLTGLDNRDELLTFQPVTSQICNLQKHCVHNEILLMPTTSALTGEPGLPVLTYRDITTTGAW